MKGRAISLLISALYVVGAVWSGGPELGAKALASCLLPLACIWFSDAMGAYAGNFGGGSGITAESPGCIVSLVGWALLLFPFWGAGLKWLILRFLV